MKSRLLSSLFIVLLAFSACNENSDVTTPASTSDAPNSIAVNIGLLSLDMEQAALVDEMYFMDEDLSLLLDPVKLDAFNSILDDRASLSDRRPGIDMAAIIYYHLIVKANPDLGERLLTQIRELIAASNAMRQRILQSGKSREEILKLLQAEHASLIRKINALIGPEAVANVEKLKQRLEEERKDRRDDWQLVRVGRLVELMTKTLELSEEEATAVKRILMLQYEEIARLRELYKDNPEGFREALKDLQARIDAMMAEAIGAKWERWKELQKKRITPNDRDPNIDLKVRELTKILGLNERQAVALKELLVIQQQEILKLKQKYANDRAGLAEALKALQARIDAKFASILTPEQLEKWKRLHQVKTGTGEKG
jgi:hypothetical protein